jgi:hypothetical protein
MAHMLRKVRVSSVGIANRYGLKSPGSNSGEGEILCTRAEWSWGPPNLQYKKHQIYFRR